jgi:TIR domain-containing protein
VPFVPDPDVKFDVFVSYAHVDNLEGWVERFHKQLSIKLDQRGGRAGEIMIWRDPKLDEATLFDAVIRDRVEHSALFLALCSSGYKRSDYCKGEFEAFCKRYGDARLRVNERSRILRARLQNIPYEELPGTSDRTSAFDFFVAADDDPIGKLLETDSPAFRDKVDRLSTVIWLMLQDLRSMGKASPLPEAALTRSRSVFIAEVADSQRKARERLVADLGSLGVAVAPRTPPPFPAADHEKAARARLAGSKLVVHLIDAWGDNSVEGREDRTYSQEQFRLAQELKLPQLLWISPRVPLAQSAPSESLDTGWIGRLNELESAKRAEDQYQIVRCPASELPALVAARLPKEKEPDAADAPAVLLDTHERDHLIAFDVCKTLLTSGIRPDLLAQQDGPGQNSSLFAERLAKTRGLIVLYGQASEEWVRARLDEGRKLMVSNPGGGLRFCGVLLAPPSVAKPESFEHPLFKTTVLDIRQGLSPAALGPVLQGLGVH